MFHRLLALIIKELQVLLKNPQTRFILIMPVILQMTLFPFAATLEVTNATIAIYNEDNGSSSTELIQRFARAKAFSHVRFLYRAQDIEPTINNQRALLVLRFPPDFSRQIENGEGAQLQVILDGRRSNSAQIAASYVQQIVNNYQMELMPQPPALGSSQLIVRNWYNVNLDYKWFVVPSLVAMIVTIGVLVVTSLSVAREREQGTLDQLLVSPLTTGQIFIGKAIPAVLVAIFQGSLILLAGMLLYRIPFAGSLSLFYGSMVIYSLSLIGFGLLISALCSTQQQAFIGVFVFMMPAILLSGYIAPIENMPLWLQHLTWINPIRHFTDITKQLYLKDAGFSIISVNLMALLVIALTTGSIAYLMFRRKVV